MTPATVAKTAPFESRFLDAPIPRRERRPSLFARIWRALEESGQRRAEAQVARMIQLRGGQLTDSLERDIERVFRRHP
jgi:hypothetical protein